MPLVEDLLSWIRRSDSESTYQIEADIRDELEFHLAMLIDENIDQGMAPSEARAAALRRFGRIESIESECRRVQIGPQSVLNVVRWLLPTAAVAILVAFAIASYRQQSGNQQVLSSLKETVLQLQTELAVIADRAPPIVVETFPASGAINVDPAETEIRVRFSKTMKDKSWSWCETQYPYPETNGQIHYVDRHTCVMPVKLRPATEYVLRINSPRHGNFKDDYGRSAEPFVLHFTTAPSRLASIQN